MANFVRTQILLDKKQHDQLEEIVGTCANVLDAQMQVRAYRKMRRAAEQLSQYYTDDGGLSDMTALDGEDFINI